MYFLFLFSLFFVTNGPLYKGSTKPPHVVIEIHDEEDLYLRSVVTTGVHFIALYVYRVA